MFSRVSPNVCWVLQAREPLAIFEVPPLLEQENKLVDHREVFFSNSHLIIGDFAGKKGSLSVGQAVVTSLGAKVCAAFYPVDKFNEGKFKLF